MKKKSGGIRSLFGDVKKTKAVPDKKKTTVKSLSTFRESISKKSKPSFSDKIFELVKAVAQPVRSSSDFAKIDELISKTNDPEKINAAYNRLREELLKVERNPELHYESYERRAKDVMGKLANKMAELNRAQKDIEIRASVDRLASANEKASPKKAPSSAFTKAVHEAKASASTSKDETKYKIFKEEVRKVSYVEDFKKISEKSLDKMMKQIESALSKIKDPEVLQKAVSDLYALKSQVQPNAKGVSQVNIRLDQSVKLTEKLEGMIQKFEAKANVQFKK